MQVLDGQDGCRCCIGIASSQKKPAVLNAKVAALRIADDTATDGRDRKLDAVVVRTQEGAGRNLDEERLVNMREQNELDGCR